MEDLDLSHSASRYAMQVVRLHRIETPQDHFRAYARILPCQESGAPKPGAQVETIYVDAQPDRSNLEEYFRRGDQAVRLRCKLADPQRRREDATAE
jgi:hypothetical protein